MEISQSLIALAVIWVLAYNRSRMSTILASVLITLLAVTLLFGIAWLPWTLLAVVALFYFADGLRRQFLTLPLYRFFKKVLPPMNSTELEALEAGDVWWEAELFKGDPDWRQMLAFPKPELSNAEQAFLDNQTETLCGLLDDWDIVYKQKNLPPQAWDYLRKEGFFGMIIPKEYGGLGFSALAHSAVVVKIATKSSSAAVTAMVPNSLGPAELLLKYGTDEQKNRYLPGLAKGTEIPCFALTSPEAGSDAGAITDSGIVCKGEYEGREVLGISLTWNKRYITLAPVATVLGLAFKLYDPDHLLGENEELGITVALIPTSHPGVNTGNRHIPMGMAFMNGPTSGKDVFVPLDWIIGGVEYAGQGWRMLVECLSEGRAISLPALSTATAKTCYRLTGAYAKTRKQFNLAIGNFEGVEEALSRIAGHCYQLEAARIMTAGAVDLHIKPSVVGAIAKYHMTEKARAVIQDAMDIHGGRGLIMGSKNYLAHCYISTPIAITVEGANILTRNLIIFGQGAIRCHPFIFRQMQAAKNPDEQHGLREFDSLIFRHIGYSISNFVRTLSLSLTGGRIVRKPVMDSTGRYYQQLTRVSAAFSLVSDIAMMLLGGGLKRKERLSSRLGDVLSQLYLASAVLKYYEDSGRQPEDLPYVNWNIQYALYNSQVAFNEVFENLPNRFVAFILRRMVFPLGDAFQLPDDHLEHELMGAMLSRSELRDRLTRHMYLSKDPDNATFIVEDAFNKVLATKEVRLAIRDGVRKGRLPDTVDLPRQAEAAVAAELCTREDADAWLTAEAARNLAIQVDDYPPDYFPG
ncbi:MAG: acyl-CoA dehydrogenase [Pseudohongiellaceae bacterium]